MEPPRGALDGDDNRVVDHAVNGGGGYDRITEIVAKLLEVYV